MLNTWWLCNWLTIIDKKRTKFENRIFNKKRIERFESAVGKVKREKNATDWSVNWKKWTAFELSFWKERKSWIIWRLGPFKTEEREKDWERKGDEKKAKRENDTDSKQVSFFTRNGVWYGVNCVCVFCSFVSRRLGYPSWYVGEVERETN